MAFPAVVLCLLLALSGATQASLNGHCSVGSTPGTCIANADCTKAGGTSTPGYCPNDPTDIKCCTKTSCDSGKGSCKWKSECSGTPQAGFCPGPSDFQCCESSTPSGVTPSGSGSSIVTWGRTEVGKIPYVWAGGHGGTPGPTTGCCSTGPSCAYTGPQPCKATSTTGFDCSGFTRWAVWKARGSDILGSGSTNGQETRLKGKEVSRADLQPGDLIYYGPVGKSHHTAIYVGSTQLEAPQTGEMVSEKLFRAGDRYYRVP